MADQSSFHGEWAFKARDQCGLGKGEMSPSPMIGRKAGMRGGIASWWGYTERVKGQAAAALSLQRA